VELIEVKILDISVSEILDIVKDARLKGYVQGVDFDFTYHPPKFDNFSGNAVYNRCVVFKFYKEELATWFSLMYQ
jgi:hypothetical protein